MNGLFDGFRQTESFAGRQVWFAGANTENGFIGSYPAIADEGGLKRLYIIKGGSGTGKSTMMLRLGEAAEEAGHRAEYFLCGSDPESLDAVRLDGKIVMLDGTAPHVADMRYPGAASSLADLSRFWDPELLEARREEIAAHAALKQAEYASAYRLLGAAGLLLREEAALSEGRFLREKAEGYAARLVKKLGRPDPAGEAGEYFTHGITMRGRRSVPTLGAGAGIRYVLEDRDGCAWQMLPVLAAALRRAGWKITVGRFPLCGLLTGIRAGDFSFTVGRAGEGEVPIRMTRFVDPAARRGRLRLTERLREACLAEADTRLAAAAEHHFALEEIYRPAMDFSAKEAYEKKLIGEILGRL